jgi:hypothetical protein
MEFNIGIGEQDREAIAGDPSKLWQTAIRFTLRPTTITGRLPGHALIPCIQCLSSSTPS